MPSYLVKAQKKMSLYAKRRSRTILDGEYGSVFKGRSIDFDDLRNYVYGDDCRDIDWKATARSGSTLIRRYIAVRKHNVMLVADIGRSMSAFASGKETKRNVALFAAGVIAYIVQNHGDLLGLVAGDATRVKRFPLKENTNHIESLLNTYHDAISQNAPPSSITTVLDYVLRSYRERMLLIIITDPTSAQSIDEALLRRLRVRHEQTYIIIGDAAVTDSGLKNDDIYDINDHSSVPSFIRMSGKFRKTELQSTKTTEENITHRFLKQGISCTFIDREADVINNVLKLLERQKRARRR